MCERSLVLFSIVGFFLDEVEGVVVALGEYIKMKTKD